VLGFHNQINVLNANINFKISIMKSRFHKKLSLKKVTIFKHKIFGGSATPNNESVPTQSSAFHEPTEPPAVVDSIINTVDPDDPILISGNQQSCM
jgi:hypothetical protein